MPTRFIPAVTAVAAAMLLCVGCHSADKAVNDPATKMQAITGTVAYLLRIALPPDAMVNVRLEETQSDAPATMIAETSVATNGMQPPIAFVLEFEASKIIANHRYQVRATITSGGEPLFVTKGVYPVLTDGAGAHVEILLEQAAGGDAKPGSAVLENLQWHLVELNGQPSLPSDGPRQASIMFETRHHTIAANTGVNSMGGEYALKAGSLSIKPGMMTMMAGSEPMMKQEQAFIAALGKVTAYRIKDRTLDLLAGDKVIMTFEAAAK